MAERVERATGSKAPKLSTAVAVVAPDMSRPERDYSIHERFAVADRVKHPRFGSGVVSQVADGKITVLFGSEQKVLAAGR